MLCASPLTEVPCAEGALSDYVMMKDRLIQEKQLNKKKPTADSNQKQQEQPCSDTMLS